MNELMNEYFMWFAYQTGILGEIRRFEPFGAGCLLVLGVINCFLGFKTYRMFFSVFLFSLIAAVCSICFRSRMDWGAVVTCFAVLGTVLAFLSYQWYRLGGCIIGGVIGMGIGWLLFPTVWSAAAGGALGMVFAFYFPVIAVCLLTALWGGGMLSGLAVVPGGNYAFPLFAAAGFALQMVMNRSQTLFSRVCPDRVSHWLEGKRKK